MRTLLVGDTHLKNRIILPIVAEKAVALKCQQIVLLGDYVDEWHQEQKVTLYRAEMNYLLQWKQAMIQRGFKVVTLLGNHDSAYLTRTIHPYSLQIASGFEWVRSQFLQLGLQVALKIDDFLITHAGLCWGNDLETDYFRPITAQDFRMVKMLAERVGQARGGRHWNGSPIWADYEHELLDAPNPHFLKQIVGHTPVRQITLTSDRPDQLIDIDTFSIHGNFMNHLYGDGSLLLLDHGQLEVVATDWTTAPAVQTYLHDEIYVH
ncbi:metallophosphoesterase [Lapidilactobacillus wuchangensis]|uniref:metallophosphoesterase n=1 Tax=Lapidilactobacillus wuchangensis TaxID=2486001 RepID=UPI000F7AF930|nr:metallophosphoesterase [Lapidilactobacillus wuchangensis]